MNFSEALEQLRNGKLLRRAGWADDCFIFLVGGSEFRVNRAPLNEIFPEGTPIRYAPHIDVCIGHNISVWEAQTMDILANDWGITDAS